jgi:hypothetical protein
MPSMAKCPRCSTRKAKRHCPALGVMICAPCCARERLQTIPCVEDCPHLQSEIYQAQRRRERAASHGREFLERQQKLFASPAARSFAMMLHADIYFHARETKRPVDDETLVDVLESLQRSFGAIYIPATTAHPLLSFLVERLKDASRYPSGKEASAADRTRALRLLAESIRSRTSPGSRRHHEEISSFFDELDFEADLDYSPHDAARNAAGERSPLLHDPALLDAGFDSPQRSPGGLILPG